MNSSLLLDQPTFRFLACLLTYTVNLSFVSTINLIFQFAKDPSYKNYANPTNMIERAEGKGKAERKGNNINTR